MKISVKELICFLAAVSLSISFSGCQKAPEQAAVVSKSDGSFDVSKVETSAAQKDKEEGKTVFLQDEFESTDHSVHFILNSEIMFTTEPMPVVEVSPHFLTEDDVKNIAHSVFGNADFYEARPVLGEPYELFSREEMIEFLKRWNQYTTQESLDAVFGKGGKYTPEVVKAFIEGYTAALDKAPEKTEQIPCKWTFQPDYMYTHGESDLETVDSDDFNEAIQAELTFEGLPYRFGAATRNRDDFKLNYIYAMVNNNSPAGFDQDILRSELQNTAPGSEEMYEMLTEKVAVWLNSMGVGQWQVESCHESSQNSFGEGGPVSRKITVRAVPVLQNIPAIRMPQLSNLRSNAGYASNYYFTDAEFNFTTDGKLLDFFIYSPIDTKKVISENTEVLSIDGLIERARQYFSLSDIYEYAHLSEENVKQVICEVSVSRIEYGLTRVKAPNTDLSYYYVPAMSFWGKTEITDCKSGDLWYEPKEQLLLCLNAVDGSVISVKNPVQ